MRGSDLSFILSVLQGKKVKYKPSDWYRWLSDRVKGKLCRNAIATQ